MAAGGPIAALPPAAVVGRIAAGAAAGPLAVLTAGAQITATVLGMDAAGRVLLKTDAGTVALAKRVEAARGAVVMIEVREAGAQPVVAVRVLTPAPPQPGRPEGDPDGPQPGPAVDPRLAAALLPPPEQARALPPGHERVAVVLAAWAGLDRALRALVARDPVLARDLCTRRLPAPGADLARLMAGWVALVRGGGTLADWAGTGTARALARHAPDEARTLDADLSALRSVAHAELEDGWRLLPIPFLTYDGLRPLTLLWRGEADGSGEDGAEDVEGMPNRFLVQVDPPGFGPVQLDGLLTGRRFALAVRSIEALPTAVANDVGTLFRAGCRLGALEGELRFAVGPFPIDPAALLVTGQRTTMLA